MVVKINSKLLRVKKTAANLISNRKQNLLKHCHHVTVWESSLQYNNTEYTSDFLIKHCNEIHLHSTNDQMHMQNVVKS